MSALIRQKKKKKKETKKKQKKTKNENTKGLNECFLKRSATLINEIPWLEK